MPRSRPNRALWIASAAAWGCIAPSACRIENPEFDGQGTGSASGYAATEFDSGAVVQDEGTPPTSDDTVPPRSGSEDAGSTDGASSGAPVSDDGAAQCPVDATWCDDACVDILANETHCGGCGNACLVGDVCDAGSCVAGCGEDLMLCGVECIDVLKSAEHCGECGNACPMWAWCDEGTCNCPFSEACGDTCANTQNDEAHCGECFAACADGQTCNDGNCS